MKNLKNKSAVILNPERSEWVSRSHVTSVESVVSDGAKTKRYSAKRDLYGDFAYAQPLKMTVLAFLLLLNISESRAAWSDNCPSGTTAGTNCKQCGTDCAFTQTSDGEITLYGSGEVGSGYTWKTIGGVYSYYSGDTADTKHPFLQNSNITSVSFDESSNFTSIGSYAFGEATSLTGITIPDSVTSISGRAFFGATGLTSITIPEGVTSIGGEAFSRETGLTSTTGLTSITLPGSLMNIGNALFYNNTILTEINCTGTEEQCNALETLLDSKGYLPNGRNFNRVEPVTKCSSYTSSGCNACYAGYALSGNACVENTQQSSQAGGASTGGDVSGDFNPADCYNKGQVPYENKCWDEYPFARKRWTPAEAAQWLHDGNDNFVVITFKK